MESDHQGREGSRAPAYLAKVASALKHLSTSVTVTKVVPHGPSQCGPGGVYSELLL